MAQMGLILSFMCAVICVTADSRRFIGEDPEKIGWRFEAVISEESEPKRDYELENIPRTPAPAQRTTQKTPATSGTHCYSCMSKIYETYWQPNQFYRLYNVPEVYSDKCTHDTLERDLPLVPCKSICISLKEEIHTETSWEWGHLRGCIDTVLHSNVFFNQTAVDAHLWYQKSYCRWYRKPQLFINIVVPNQRAHVCVCFNNKCNDGLTHTQRDNAAAETQWYQKSKLKHGGRGDATAPRTKFGVLLAALLLVARNY